MPWTFWTRSTVSAVDPTLSHLNAFKIPQLRGIADTGPYFHDNSAKTLEDVMNHYETAALKRSPHAAAGR